MKPPDEHRIRREPALRGPLKRPAGERPGGLADVVLGVVTDAGGEELHQLAGVVLIRLALPVRFGVEVDHHRRVFRYGFEQVVEVTHRHLPKELVLGEHLGGAGLVEPAGQQAVPEQRHLFLERPRRLHHSLQPPSLDGRNRGGTATAARIHRGERRVERGVRGLRAIEQHLRGAGGAHRQVAVELAGRGAEARAPKEMRDADPLVVERALVAMREVADVVEDL